ncbi:hypothetical protein K2X30_12050 [bacterium]|nr:hypothetical protein [bacterium]
MSKSLVLYSNNPDDKIFAAEAAAVAHLNLEVKSDFIGVADALAAGEVGAVFCEIIDQAAFRKFEEAIQSRVGLFSDKVNGNHFHFLTDLDIEKTTFLLESPLFGNFVLRHYESPKADGQHYGRIVAASQTDRAFGLESIMKSKTQSVKLEWTTQKQDAVDAVRNYLLAAKFKARMATTVANAVDEILMNAMYDAPVDDLGKSIYQSTPRSTPMKLENKAAVQMEITYDGKYVAVSAIDLYGSVDKKKLLAHMAKSYQREEFRVRATHQGAGVGLGQVFRSGGSVLFSSEAGSRTEVTIMFRRLDMFREFKDQFRFLGTQFYF